MKVKVDITGIAATGNKISVLALNVEKENGENITSDYATVFKKDLNDLAIADPAAEAARKVLQIKMSIIELLLVQLMLMLIIRILFGLKDQLRLHLN